MDILFHIIELALLGWLCLRKEPAVKPIQEMKLQLSTAKCPRGPNVNPDNPYDPLR